MVLAGVALVGLAVAAALLLAGGDEPAPADKTGDGPVSGARLLEAADLPGGPWQVTTDATLAKAGGISGFPSSAVPPSEECAMVHNFEGELARLDASFSSGASRVVQREGAPGQSPATVTHTLLVFSDSVDLDPVLGGVAAALNGPGFGPCLEQGAGAAGLEATVSPVSALVPPPNGGAAAGLRLAKRAAPGEAPLILQLFYWRTGQTLTVVSIVGPESVVTRDLVTEAVAAAQRAFERRSP
ncbi:MAG: hypothetical protein C0506_07895 [Anaerolinea sp.]|nr:hypothetical protein [Anaerolinea sp.]